MSKKQAKKSAPAQPHIVEGIDGRVLINVYSPGHEPQEFRVTIPNISGATNLLHRSPEYIAAEVIKGLRAKYGERVG